MELDRHGAELIFQALTEREEKNSVAIASNESFGGWTKTFTDPRLCAAIVEQHGAEILDGPNEVPTGRNLTVQHPGGVITEYVQFHATARSALA